MRTTIRIDDALMEDLRQRARREKLSLTRFVNRTLRLGLEASAAAVRPRRRFRQKVFSLGQPAVDLTKALAVAAALEDEEVLRKLAMRK
jgi:hypothetical protein